LFSLLGTAFPFFALEHSNELLSSPSTGHEVERRNVHRRSKDKIILLCPVCGRHAHWYSGYLARSVGFYGKSHFLKGDLKDPSTHWANPHAEGDQPEK
jgi:hypothetical protein